MSYLYGLDPNEQNKELDFANTHPADLSAIKPDFWEGTGASIVNNLKIGGLKVLMAGSYFRDPDEALGAAMSGYDKELDERMAAARSDMAKTAKALTPNPLITGTGAQVLGGLAQIAPLAVGAGAVGGPVAAMAAVGVTQGVGDYQESTLDGIDPNTAVKKALLTGAAAGIGVAVPMAKVGAGLATNLAIGAGVNVGLGTAQRAGTAAILEHAGYTEQAKQYNWLDKDALLVDAVLGAAFGGIGHFMARGVTPEHVDAALKLNEQTHAEISGQPGVHRTPESRDAGAEAFRSALDDVLVRDRVPDVGDLAARMDMEPNPEAHAFYKEVDDTIRPELPKEEPVFQPKSAERVEEAAARAEEAATRAAKAAGRTPQDAAAPVAEAAVKPHDGTVEGMAKSGDVRPIEDAQSKQILDTHPDIELPTGKLNEDGTPATAKFSDLLANADKHIADTQKEASLHDVAVACFLRG